MNKSQKAPSVPYFGLLGLNVITQMKNFIDFISVVFRFYSNWKFCKIDLALITLYLGNSPFAVSKEFLLKKREKNVYAYGETPLTTLDMIAKTCEINAQDTVYELGCGRGRGCFWLNAFVGCKVVGIDYVPVFIERATTIKNRFDVKGVEFRLQDMLTADYSEATVIYLYGTSLDDETILKLIEKFKELPAGTKIITVTYSLNEFCAEPVFEVMKRFTADFPWGTTDVYLQYKRD